MACAYISGQMEGLFVHRASSREVGQVWIPKLCQSFTCNTGMEHYQIGQWLLIDMIKKHAVRELHSGPYESEPYKITKFPDSVFVKVKVPIVFYSMPSENPNNKVAYSPQFGRIGCFFQQINLVTDKLRYAWIAYMYLFRGDGDLRKLLKSLNVEWMVCNLENVLTTEQIREENKKYQQKFCTGIVVHCKEEKLLELNGASENKYIALQIWTPNLDGRKPVIAIHRILKGKLEADEQMKKLKTIGTFCKLMIFKNWADEFTAVSPFPIEIPTGYYVEQIEPNLKLKVGHDQYHLDQDSDALQVNIPLLVGPITCSRDFIRQLRCVRQAYPLYLPRLFIEFHREFNEWKAVNFDGNERSPSPKPSTSETIPQFPGCVSAFTKYRTPKSFPISSEESLDDSPPSSDNPVAHQRHGNVEVIRDSLPPSICSDFYGSDDEEIGALADAVKTGIDLDNTTTNELTSTNHPSGRPHQLNRVFLSESSASHRPNSISFPNNSPSRSFLDRLFHPIRVLLAGKKNISGILVSKTEDGFYVYTPSYHPKELFLPNSKAGPGCVHGSWLFFDTKEENDHVEIINPRLDATMPYETIVVRNTVQLKLTGMVPKKWTPQMSSFVPVINTNYVTEVIDSKGLLNQDYTGVTLPVLVERKKDKKTSYMWFIAGI